MKVIITMGNTALQDRVAKLVEPYERLNDEGRLVVEGVERINCGIGGELVLERGELVFYYGSDSVLNFTVEPEALRTKLKSQANDALAALQDCDRCRAGDVLGVCTCAQWCGQDMCLSEDGRLTVDKGPRLADPWDKELPYAEDQPLPS